MGAQAGDPPPTRVRGSINFTGRGPSAGAQGTIAVSRHRKPLIKLLAHRRMTEERFDDFAGLRDVRFGTYCLAKYSTPLVGHGEDSRWWKLMPSPSAVAAENIPVS